MNAGEPRSTAIRLGSYEVLHRFAKGGMAELFLARAIGPEGFSKLVVLKKILPTFAANPRFVRLFLDEAKLAASLDHPNIAHVHDLGKVDGHYFFTMEYVHGKDVRALLHRSLNSKTVLPIAHVVHIARSVSAALHYAHERRGPDGSLLGIVHRDVSPSNVIVSFEGTVKLLDFGVAKAASSTVKTRTGALKGKVAYMSPEQAKGAAVDRRSDVFSTGIVMWEMATARRLYKRDNDLATIQMIINETPPRPSTVRSDIPPELDRIILRALAVDPEVRYQNAEDLQADLDELAREHKLNQSTIALSRHMGTLFATEIELWKRAEAKGQQLSDHLIAVSVSDAPASRATPASDMLLDAFSEHGNGDDDDDSDEAEESQADPSLISFEADAERTERSDVPLEPSRLAATEQMPRIPAPPPKVAPQPPTVAAAPKIRYSRPGLEPRNWDSEPSIVLEDSLSDGEAFAAIAADEVAAATAPVTETAGAPFNAGPTAPFSAPAAERPNASRMTVQGIAPAHPRSTAPFSAPAPAPVVAAQLVVGMPAPIGVTEVEAASAVAVEVPSAAPQAAIKFEKTMHVARLPAPPAVRSADDAGVPSLRPARRTGVWIGVAAAAIVALVVVMVQRSGNSKADNSTAPSGPTESDTVPAATGPAESAASADPPEATTPEMTAPTKTPTTTTATTTTPTTTTTTTTPTTTTPTTTTPTTTVKTTTTPTTTTPTTTTPTTTTPTTTTPTTATPTTTTPTPTTPTPTPTTTTTTTPTTTVKTATTPTTTPSKVTAPATTVKTATTPTTTPSKVTAPATTVKAATTPTTAPSKVTAPPTAKTTTATTTATSKVTAPATPAKTTTAPTTAPATAVKTTAPTTAPSKVTAPATAVKTTPPTTAPSKVTAPAKVAAPTKPKSKPPRKKPPSEKPAAKFDPNAALPPM